MSERIVIKVPKRYSLTYLPMTLSVSRIASLLVYGLKSPPPTESICRSASFRRMLLQEYGSHEPIYQRAIFVVRDNKTSKIILKGRPDEIDRSYIPTIIELRPYNKNSKKSRENTIRIASIKLQIYMNMMSGTSTAISRSKMILFTLPPVDETEFCGKTFLPDKKVFKKIIISAIQMYSLSKKTEQKEKEIRNTFDSSMKKLKYF